MTVKELIERLRRMPQDQDIEVSEYLIETETFRNHEIRDIMPAINGGKKEVQILIDDVG